MNLCTGTIIAAALAAIGVIANIMRLRAQGIRITLPAHKDGYRRFEALQDTRVDYEELS